MKSKFLGLSLCKGGLDTPVVNIDVDKFSELIGRRVNLSELVEKIPLIGVDIEDVGERYIKVEYNPNRPDLGTLVGIARAYKGITRQEVGLKMYRQLVSDYEIDVDESVGEVRPYIAGAVIKNVSMSDELIEELISFQEDLHAGIGRKRRKVAIGIHNLDVINFPLSYVAIEDDGFKFTPLNSDREMTIREILEETETGREYGYIVSRIGRYPLILDASKRVLSFPPVINSNHTRVTEETRNLFIDVTGTDYNAILNVVNLLTTYLSDMGGEIWCVTIKYPSSREITPQLGSKEIVVEKSLIENLLGINLTDEQIIDCIRVCRLNASIEGNGRIRVKIPPYRVDIMHPVDIVEEVAVGYGYQNIKLELPRVQQIGSKNERTEFKFLISDIMVSLGMQEVVNFTLSNLETQFRKMNLKPEGYVKVKKSKSRELEILRRWLTPDLLTILSRSQKEKLPQTIFEIGKVFFKSNDNLLEEYHLGVAITHSRAGYSDIKSVLDALMESLEVKVAVKEIHHPSFIEGRVGTVVADEDKIGLIGEIHPSVLESFSIENPVSILELNLDKLHEFYKSL